MTRYVMVADLRRCVGCQTCTAAARWCPASAPTRWPSSGPPRWACSATGQRADGIVTIDDALCIGCSYCAMACPYDARSMVDRAEYAFGDTPTAPEAARADRRTIGVATKCTFCAGRIDAGTARGLVPGQDPEATPLCVNSCISGALSFGDIEDRNGPVTTLLAENQWFRMHEDEGTEPGFYYIWDKGRL